MNITKTAKMTGKSYAAIRKKCVKGCPGVIEIQGYGYFRVSDVSKKDSKYKVYDLKHVDAEEAKKVYRGKHKGKHSNKEEEKPENKSNRDLDSEYRLVKIKREQQQLHEQRVLLAEQITDVVIESYITPKFAELTDIIRKHGNKELQNEWNKAIKSAWSEDLSSLRKELRNVILK